ncbi:MAG: hypothetical protein WBX38_04445 [Candidatus Sulfotelmatobacter sp.]
MRRRASHPTPHRSCDLSFCLPPLEAAGRRHWTESAHEERHFSQYIREAAIHGTAAAQLCDGQRPIPLKERKEEAAMPWATGTRSRAFPNFPRQFTLENCQSATSVTANHRPAKP